LPPLALLAACGTLTALRASSLGKLRWARWLPPLVLLFAALTSLPRLASKSVPAMALQFETLREVERVSARDDRFFDLVGLYFRPDAYPVFSMSGDLFRWYTFGHFPPIPLALRQNEAVGILLNYRVGWLRPSEREFVAERFVHHTGNLFLLGRDLARLAPGVDTEFEALKTKRFRFEGTGTLWLDGQPFRDGVIEKGTHTIRVERLEGPGRLILATPAGGAEITPPAELFTQFD
jgi:hypothetical protein